MLVLQKNRNSFFVNNRFTISSYWVVDDAKPFDVFYGVGSTFFLHSIKLLLGAFYAFDQRRDEHCASALPDFETLKGKDAGVIMSIENEPRQSLQLPRASLNGNGSGKAGRPFAVAIGAGSKLARHI